MTNLELIHKLEEQFDLLNTQIKNILNAKYEIGQKAAYLNSLISTQSILLADLRKLTTEEDQ
jgi:hypothetical protein